MPSALSVIGAVCRGSVDQIIHGTGASRDAAERLQEQAEALQVALDNRALRRLRVEELHRVAADGDV